MPPIQRKELRNAYGYDDVAIVPGEKTINPEIVDISTSIAGLDLDVPILASAMDAVVDPYFAIQLGRRGGLAVLNLEGLQCRFDDPDEILDRVAAPGGGGGGTGGAAGGGGGGGGAGGAAAGAGVVADGFNPEKSLDHDMAVAQLKARGIADSDIKFDTADAPHQC